MESDYLRRGTGEFIGTFTLVFVAGGAIMVGSGGLIGVAVAQGLAIAVMVTALAHISGGHFNHTWIYYVGPFAGGVIAALLYEYLFLRQPVETPGPEETGLIEPGVGE